MLSLFMAVGLLSQPAFAGGGSVVPNQAVDQSAQQYEYCMIAVLMDWDKDQALAFRMTSPQDIDLQSGVPLELNPMDEGEGMGAWAQLPFDSAFMSVMFLDQMQMVVGMIRTIAPYSLFMMQGVPIDKGQTTIQGLTGYLDILDGTPDCHVQP